MGGGSEIKMKITIDRFENDIAVVETENGDILNIPKLLLPSDAKEGSIVHITVDESETEVRRAEMKKKMNDIFNS